MRLRVRSSLTANQFADEALRSLASTVRVTEMESAGAACVSPTALESANVQFGLTVNNAVNGTLPFPLLLNFSHPPGQSFLYQRRERALYLCFNGQWVNAASEQFCSSDFVTNWGLSAAFRDRVPNAYTFLFSYTCHNTDFSLLQAKCEGASTNKFVRKCNDCIPDHFGCQCTATDAANGYARDSVSMALAFAIGIAGAVMAVSINHLRPLHGQHRALVNRSEGDSDTDLACSYQTLWAIALVLSAFAMAVAAVAQIGRSPGEPYIENLDASAYWGVSFFPAALLVGTAFVAAVLRGQWWMAPVLLADLFLTVWWVLPSLMAWPARVTAAYFGSAVGLSIAQYAVVAPDEQRNTKSVWAVLVVVALMTVRILLWMRLPCE